MNPWMKDIVYDEKGLVPAVVQDARTQEVLMLAYMNEESLEKTMQDGEAWFYSRSRQSLWKKGETSGNVLKLLRIDYDCDADTLLLQVNPAGPVCHTGARTCFYRCGWSRDPQPGDWPGGWFLPRLDRTVSQRKADSPDSSYTAQLFSAGLDRILKKVGEESGEVMIAAKNSDSQELVYEMADLWYHCLVLLHSKGLTLADVDAELARRRKGGD